MEVQFLRHIWKGVQKTKECIQVRILLKNGVVELNSEMAVTGFFRINDSLGICYVKWVGRF